MGKEPTRAQLSSRLAYNEKTPAFLRRLQARVSGQADPEDEIEDEWGDRYEDDGSGRPPIPVRPRDERPPIPTRPDDDPGSADEEDGDEKPQVVVLREGKHLSEWEAENVKRQEKGLAPLSDPNAPSTQLDSQSSSSTKSKKHKESPPTLSFSSTNKSKDGADNFGKLASSVKKKRKAIGSQSPEPQSGQKDGGPKKKVKKSKESKTLLSFGDDA